MDTSTVPATTERFLSDVIVELGFVDRNRVDEAVEEARTPGKTVGGILLERGVLTEEQLARAVATRNSIEFLDLDEREIDEGAAGLLGESAAKRYQALPIGFVDSETLLVGMVDPADGLAINDIGMITRLEIQPAVVPRGQLLSAIEEHAGKHPPPSPTGVPTELLGKPVVAPESATAAPAPSPAAGILSAQAEELSQLRQRLAEAEGRVAELDRRLGEETGRRAEIERERDELAGQREAIGFEELMRERDDLTRERDELTRERDELKAREGDIETMQQELARSRRDAEELRGAAARADEARTALNEMRERLEVEAQLRARREREAAEANERLESAKAALGVGGPNAPEQADEPDDD